MLRLLQIATSSSPARIPQLALASHPSSSLLPQEHCAPSFGRHKKGACSRSKSHHLSSLRGFVFRRCLFSSLPSYKDFNSRKITGCNHLLVGKIFHALFPYGLCLNKPSSSCSFHQASPRPKVLISGGLSTPNPGGFWRLLWVPSTAEC